MLTSRGSEWNRWDLHIHTASSYDYNYRAADADDILCDALKQNNIKAAVITDHFLIDQSRIESLRTKAPEIVFFPGVELRTDKGANNLHLILIFSDQSDLKELSEDFEVTMRRGKAKSKESDNTIYWEFADIVEFAKAHNALISIHAGRKTNGIDKEISNALPVQVAIKSDIAEAVHFFEIGQKRDIQDYEQHVFKDIARKPLIMCSDNHSPKEYTVKENLWIKADLTFAGLKQCLYQPQERVFIGSIPPVLDRVTKNKQSNITSVACSRIGKPVNKDSTWFDFDLPLNPSMVAIIGNKGSGKSAFSDIIGLLCRCNTMTSASFLNDTRFRKKPKNYAADYSAKLAWLDGEERQSSLSASQNDSSIEDAQYLPQRYIEDVCNDFGDAFQKEIDKVIFSYVDKAERGDAQNLNGLVRLKSKPLEIRFHDERSKLEDINRKIISIERKKTKEYRKSTEDCLKNSEESLKRHEKSKPEVVKKPSQEEVDNAYQHKLTKINTAIQEKKGENKKASERVAEINIYISDVQTVLAQISRLETQHKTTIRSITELVEKYNLDITNCNTVLITPKEYLREEIQRATEEKSALLTSISKASNELTSLESEKESLISSADAEEKKYQKYLADQDAWNEKKLTITGDKWTEGSIEFYKNELDYIDNKLDQEYAALKEEREAITTCIYEGIEELSRVYENIYAPVQDEIAQLLGNLEDGVAFQAEVFLKSTNMAHTIVDFINQRYNGKFGRSHNAIQEIESIISETDFSCRESVFNFIREMESVISDEFETADKRVAKRQEFYDYIFGLEYIDVNFKLKMGGRSLEELSPGERGIVLLIFYLALSKESKPIIIDQPEDNLDNQSVYSKLVPCICKAKQKRQVIIVTHNPNIAVACDAEQIVYCEKDKNSSQIRYESGSIENPKIRDHVVDVLEGTMPAFDLRRHKYRK